MKVALIKQVLDVFGPWSSVRWEDTTPTLLFDIWPGKASAWEMTCLLKADWYITTQQLETDYIRDAVLKHAGRREIILQHSSGIVPPDRIPLNEYDLVITFDPILDLPANSATVFAYIMQEHWDHLYGQSLKKPMRNYDLFLAHMMDSASELHALPQAVSFPLLRAPDVARSLFPVEKAEVVCVDWRTLTTLAMVDLWDEAAEKARTRLEQVIGLPVRCRGSFSATPYGISNPPAWGDSADYLRSLAECKYYLSVGRNSGAGQGLCDAASLGCICIGEENKSFHRMICHPACLCADMSELPARVRTVVSSPSLQEDVLAWQEKALRREFMTKPLGILEQAVGLKHKLVH